MKISCHKIILASIVLVVASCCSRENTLSKNTESQNIETWLTKADETIKLQKQNTILSFTTTPNTYQNIEIDPSVAFQSIDGFGYTLTGGSVEVINKLSPTKRKELLQEVFGNGEEGIGVSYLRLSIGASDLNSSVFSYDDMPSGQTDEDLSEFSLAKDQPLVDMLKEILAINPKIKIIATPWSPPVWMKNNGSSIGGSLIPEYYDVYAQYFVKYIQEMRKNGIVIDAITPQNEPLHPGNNPSMYMPAEEQRDFIKNNLGPAFKKAQIATKIVVYDHNCDKPQYPLTILKDPEAAAFIDGSAFHLYAGNVNALGTVKAAFPDKNTYFTEQWTGSKGSFAGDLIWHTQNVIIGTMRNWSKTALEWNLANDQQYQPFTQGGCTECKGAITINSADSFTRNVGYYIIAQASKFIPQNSVRIASSETNNLASIAFKRPDGKMVLLMVNGGNSKENFNIKINGKYASTYLEAQTVATYIF